jgi:predicted GIY-YIG superfamily endonuclease
MSTLYVLQLEDDKWYVGKTDDITKRYEQHKSGKGSVWTKEYKPIKLVETRTITSVHDETNVTKDLMKKYGVDNVRGGAYCQMELPDGIKETIRHEMTSNSDKCYNCGLKGHFSNKCPKKESAIPQPKSLPMSVMIPIEQHALQDISTRECKEEECWLCEYCDRKFDTKYGSTVHERTCKNKKTIYTDPKQSGSCYKCGRSGHYSPDCYARTHISGYEIRRNEV